MQRPPSPSARLDAVFSALADPTRRAILARLARGDASVTELAEPFRMSQPAISKHLRVLERAGLIAAHEPRRRAGARPVTRTDIRTDRRMRLRRIDGRPLRAVSRWLEGYRRFWEGSLERLDTLLAELQDDT